MSEETAEEKKTDRIDFSDDAENFYLRYYAGHSGRFGHEFLEFDIRYSDNGGILRYTNNSNYRNDDLIRKEVGLSKLVIKQLKRILEDSEIMMEDDNQWPRKNRDGKQELEIRVGKHHIRFETCKIGSLSDVKKCDNPEGMRVFYYVIQDVKALVFSLIALHFKIKPI